MARVDVSEADALRAVMRKLRTELQLNERQCRFTVYEDTPQIPTGVSEYGFFVTVSPGESSFDDGLVTGHPIEQCTEDATVIVTGITRVHLDETDSDEQLLFTSGRGLWNIKRRLINALSGADLQLENGDTFLRALVRPLGVSRPQIGVIGGEDEGSLPIAWISVTFAISYDWDLDRVDS